MSIVGETDSGVIEAHGPSSHSRALTAGEIDLVRSVFGEAIEVDKVSIRQQRWFPFQPRGIVMAPRGNLHFHPKGTLYCDDFAHALPSLQGLFIHEMVHVWQHQKGIFLPLRRHPFCRYSYAIKPGWRLDRYGIEQQAEIMRHWFMLDRGITVPGVTKELLEGIVPFRPIRR